MLIAFGSVFLIFVVLPAAIYIEENIRGASAWARCRRELTTRGERLDRAAFTPLPVPDAENFAFAGPFSELLAYHEDHGRLRMGKNQSPLCKKLQSALKDISGRPPPPGVDWRTGRRVDLDALADYLRGTDEQSPGVTPLTAPEQVRAALAPYGLTFDDLARTATARPAARFPLDYDASMTASIGQHHLTLLQNLARLLQLRALAALADARTGEALGDLRLTFRLVDAIKDEPTIIAHLIHNTCLGFALGVVWQGLADRRWSADELTEITALLNRSDVLARCVQALRGERGFFYLPIIDHVESRGGQDIAYLGNQNISPAARSLFRALPPGWYDQNRVVGCQLAQHLIDAVDPATHRVAPGRVVACQQETEGLRHRFPPSVWFALICLPALDNVPRTAARVQTGLDHAIAACALEHYYLAHGGYPATLDTLANVARLPRDVVDGASLRYTRTPDGRYRLWSVGWDGRDEAGRIVYKDQRPDEKVGDWVWQYTPPSNAPKPVELPLASPASGGS